MITKGQNTLDDLFAELNKDPEFRTEYRRQKPYYDYLLKTIKQQRETKITQDEKKILGLMAKECIFCQSILDGDDYYTIANDNGIHYDGNGDIVFCEYEDENNNTEIEFESLEQFRLQLSKSVSPRIYFL